MMLWISKWPLAEDSFPTPGLEALSVSAGIREDASGPCLELRLVVADLAQKCMARS